MNINLLIPGIIIIVSAGVIGFLVYKKYAELSLIDVDSVPEIKEAKKKYEYMKKKLEDRSNAQKEVSTEKMMPLQLQWKKFQDTFRSYVTHIADEVRKGAQGKEQEKLSEMPEEEKKGKVSSLIMDAGRAVQEEEYEYAEKCYIEAIRIHPRAAEAYKGLGDVYVQQEDLTEAKETFYFLHQLEPNNDAVLLRLADIAEKQNDVKNAISYYEQALLINDSHAVRFAKLAELLLKLDQHATALVAWQQAVELEPQNPKYLDNLIETAIMLGHKEIAEEQLQELRIVNPENKKIEIFQDKIRLLDVSKGTVDNS